jgi:hypothetical protein
MAICAILSLDTFSNHETIMAFHNERRSGRPSQEDVGGILKDLLFPYAKYITPIRRHNTQKKKDSIHRDAICPGLSSDTFPDDETIMAFYIERSSSRPSWEECESYRLWHTGRW